MSWVYELWCEFKEWIGHRNHYNQYEKQKQMIKYFLYTFFDIVIAVYSSRVDNLYLILFLSIFDIVLYLSRYRQVSQYDYEYNVTLFLHAIVHLVYMATTIWVFYFGFYYLSTLSNNQQFAFVTVAKWMMLRVVVYIFLSLIIIVMSPCIINKILKARKDRLEYLAIVRDEENLDLSGLELTHRARNEESILKINQSSLHGYDGPQVRENSINDHLLSKSYQL